jgi:hypothetical protein
VPPGMHREEQTPGEPEASVRDAVHGAALPGLTVFGTKTAAALQIMDPCPHPAPGAAPER